MPNSIKTTVNIPEWAEYFNQNSGLSNEARAYAYVPLIYRCVRMIADDLTSAPVIFHEWPSKDQEVEVDNPFPDLDFAEWVNKSCASILLTGATYSIKLNNGFGTNAISGGKKTRGLQWLNPFTVTPVPYLDPETGLMTVHFIRTANVLGGQTGTWTLDEMFYCHETNYSYDILPGPSPASVAMMDAGLIRYLSRFASYYFQQGAMPLTVLQIDQMTSNDERDRLENFFKAAATGIRNAFRLIALRSGRDGKQPAVPFTVTPPLIDLVMPELMAQARQNISDAFNVPMTMLQDAANRATAMQHDQQFWEGCIKPWGRRIESALNEQVFHPMGMEFEFAYDELPSFQADESVRSATLAQLTGTGLNMWRAMEILGYDLMENEQAALDAYKALDLAADVIASDERSKNAPIPPGIPSGTAPAEAPKLDGNVNNPDGALSVTDQNAGTAQTAESGAASTAATRSALFNWKRAALAAVKTGHPAAVEFDHPAIEPEIAEFLRYELAAAKTAADVHSLFKKAREMTPADPLVMLATELREARLALERANG